MEPTKQEEWLLKRLERTKKLFAFLRRHRHELFDEAFQAELSGMYRQNGEGKVPVPPALMAMAVLLQAYVGASDAEAVELTMVDARWQLVLNRLGETEPAFSQGALQAFRQRMIAHDMDRRLLERTAELAKDSGGFDHKKLPRDLRLAVDSRPLEGAGRVEDTFNLLAHAARILLREAARMTGRSPDEIAAEMGITCLMASSLKRALDIDWSDAEAKQSALERLLLEAAAVQFWVEAELSNDAGKPPLSEHLETLQRLRSQDLEPDPGGGARIKHGVARDRQVSLTDPAMRHGRKTKSKRFNGYKSHIAVDLDDRVIWACAITPANAPEASALECITRDLGERVVGEWHIDRGFIAAAEIHAAHRAGAEVVCRPWRSKTPGRFGKEDFHFDFRAKTVTCPSGVSIPIQLGSVARFPEESCSNCALKTKCTASKIGRAMNVLPDEPLQRSLRRAIATPAGRGRLRERVAVEHRLAHHAQKQGRKARYIGLRNNVFDSRRHAAVLNLETAQLRAA
jgi:hypothetical protein